MAKLRKDDFSTGDFDEFLHPTDAADERVHPLFKEDSRTARKSAGAFGDLCKVASKPLHQSEPARLGGDNPRQSEHHVKDLFHRSLIEDEYVHSAPDQIVRDLRLEVREADHQIRPEIEDLVYPGRCECRNLGLPASFRWTASIAGNADDAFVLAQQIKRLGGFFRQEDKALGAIATHIRSSHRRVLLTAAQQP